MTQETTMERYERLLDDHMLGYIRRESDMKRGYSQGVDIDIGFYTRKITHHRKMIAAYAKKLGIKQETVSKALATLRRMYAQ